ncbi:g1756 [Coccomyxa elongata]
MASKGDVELSNTGVNGNGKVLDRQVTRDYEVEEYTAHGWLAATFFWIKSWALPGIGMFCESYFIFSIGNITPIFQETYKDCYKQHKTCSEGLINAETYVQVSGIIVGMLLMGYIADQIGRKWGSALTASFMFIGGIMLTASNGVTIQGWAIMFAVSQFIFGYGVGGEYPLASSSAAERAEANKALRFRRGEMVVCTFSMQGWGNLVNTAVLCILLAIFGQTGSKYNHHALDAVWRISFGIGLIPVTFMLIYRLFFLQESKVWKRQNKPAAVALREQKVLWYHYWHRLAGCALSWFFWDVSFYGNKLFQSTFIKILYPGASILTTLEWTLLNSAVSLVGYYFSAFTVDKLWMGRVRLQSMGFLMVFILFLICAAAYDPLIKHAIKWFQALYFLSSFFGQFGPNATTWLLPGEVFPTDIRATCHGISAATGKIGALVAGIWFAYLTNAGKFYVAAFFNLAGLILTVLFVPNIMTLDLREGDRRFDAFMANKPEAYTGDATHPKNLSIFERYVLRYGRYYNAAADDKARKEEGIRSSGSLPTGHA